MPDQETVVVRFTFKPDSAADFLFKKDVAAGRYVQERDDLTLDEAIEFIEEFEGSLQDAQILIEGSRVVTMSDFREGVEGEGI